MLEKDDLTALTDQELAKWHAEAREAAPQYEILAENEWRMRPIRKQHELNKALMFEQHKLNKRLVIITAIAALVAAIVGGLLQKYGPDISWFSKMETRVETEAGRVGNSVAADPGPIGTLFHSLPCHSRHPFLAAILVSDYRADSTLRRCNSRFTTSCISMVTGCGRPHSASFLQPSLMARAAIIPTPILIKVIQPLLSFLREPPVHLPPNNTDGFYKSVTMHSIHGL